MENYSCTVTNLSKEQFDKIKKTLKGTNANLQFTKNITDEPSDNVEVKMPKEKAPRISSPYILFCNDTRDNVNKENPNATFGETGKILGQMWTNLSETDRAEYTKKSDELKKQFGGTK